jgi:hypothetical protein
MFIQFNSKLYLLCIASFDDSRVEILQYCLAFDMMVGDYLLLFFIKCSLLILFVDVEMMYGN